LADQPAGAAGDVAVTAITAVAAGAQVRGARVAAVPPSAADADPRIPEAGAAVAAGATDTVRAWSETLQR
jgi:hypothetical protein